MRNATTKVYIMETFVQLSSIATFTEVVFTVVAFNSLRAVASSLQSVFVVPFAWFNLQAIISDLVPIFPDLGAFLHKDSRPISTNVQQLAAHARRSAL